MKRRKWDKLTAEEGQAICKKCEGWCCSNFFIGIGPEDAPVEFHKFRGREIIKYAKTTAVVIPDTCPHCDKTTGMCDVYTSDTRPAVCRQFPERYTPFWNVKCKLMRELYKRKQIPANEQKFAAVLKEAGWYKSKSPFRVFK